MNITSTIVRESWSCIILIAGSNTDQIFRSCRTWHSKPIAGYLGVFISCCHNKYVLGIVIQNIFESSKAWFGTIAVTWYLENKQAWERGCENSILNLSKVLSNDLSKDLLNDLSKEYEILWFHTNTLAPLLMAYSRDFTAPLQDPGIALRAMILTYFK